MKGSQRSATMRKRLVRVRVLVPASDAALIRGLALVLRREASRTVEPSRSVGDLLAMDLDVSDEAFDAAVARPRDVGRETQI